MMKILANDGLDKKAIEVFEDNNFLVDVNHYDKNELIKAISEYDILIVRSATKVDRDLIDVARGSKLKLIIRAGVGMDNIDVHYATGNGIKVQNTPNSSSNSVAELVLGHMFGLSRHINMANMTMRQGVWNKKLYTGIEISGKTLGIIGFGRIGKTIAAKATALGMNIVFYDKFIREDKTYQYLPFTQVLNNADFLTFHISATEKPLIGEEEINLMKDGAIIINTARGGIIEEKALLEALNNNKIAGAGIDVFEEEPTPNPELCNHPNVSVTPHIGAATFEAQERIGQEVIEVVFDHIEQLEAIAS
ncbi:MAG: D-2-hydroxyacid dehydrogenase [Bacillota bacterium]